MIARLWLWLFHACRHEWEIHSEHRLMRPPPADGYWRTGKAAEPTAYGKMCLLRCKKCGEMKEKRFEADPPGVTVNVNS